MQSQLATSEKIRRTTPDPDRLLIDNHFVHITGLPAGDELVTSHPADYGCWSNHLGYVIAVTCAGKVWVNVEPVSRDLLAKQRECLRQVCPAGNCGPIFDVDEIPLRYILARAQDPNYDPHPQSSH